MSYLVPPHGGLLKPRLVSKHDKVKLLNEAGKLYQISLTSKEVSDVIMMATGAFSPLSGFMVSTDYHGVVKEMRLENGLLWPIPITLAVTEDEAYNVEVGQTVALLNSDNDDILATMVIEDKFKYDKKAEARYVFKTEDDKHPGVMGVYQQGEVYLGGPVQVVSEGGYPERFPEFARPAETRAIFSEKKWTTVTAFQTRNPMHRSHEYLTKITLEFCDGLFINPIVGKLKTDDIPAEVRMECYKVLLNKYYPSDKVVLKVYPMEMRYGGPREAILHAIIRQNYGCSHLIVGRDHAGVGNYYGPFEAQDIFNELNPGDLQIQIMKLDIAFWCYKCEAMASPNTCPHSDEDRLLISGTKVRNMLAAGEKPPLEFCRPEVADILIQYYRDRGSR